MTWDWIEVGRGIVAMEDPLHFTTNMRVLDREGDELNSTQAALLFNRFAQGLPWQDEVMRLLERQRECES